MKINLARYESTFVVFQNQTTLTNVVDKQATAITVPFRTTGKWKVTFSAITKTVVRDSLFDWSKDSDNLIKYYSGTAIYHSTFVWKENSQHKQVYLQLGKVAEMATVRINGVDCGTAWTSPFQVDITGAVKKGINTIDIDVVNTWANAINGSDKGMPPFPGIWTNAKYRMPEDKLLEAGLLGPISFMLK